MNIKLLIFSVLIYSNLNAQIDSLNYSKQVGDISFDKQLDDLDFKICVPSNTFQYYNIFEFNGAQYKGDLYEVTKQFKEKYTAIDIKQTGYIIIRFLVNCEGKTGLFRIQEMDMNYLPINFDKQITNQLLTITKSLEDWIIGGYKEKDVDYYQYLTFKIEDGKLKEISL